MVSKMKLIHFADLHLGVETYGRLDPETGLSTRFLDFLSVLDQVVDYAVENKVDLVIFCGDAYKSREPSQTQQREFAQRISHLSRNDIPIFLLTGNHDLPNAIGRATTIEIFNTLKVRNVYVSNRPDIHLIPTKSGTIQIASIPWLRRSALLSREDAKNLSLQGLNERLEQILTDIIASHALKLKPELPSILAAHVWVSGAKVGSEELGIIGQEPVLLLSNIVHPAFDYIALGHIHRHQILFSTPPVVYSGSLERLDFGEEGDEKGFYLVEIATGKETDKREVSFEFHQVSGRRFLTIEINIDPQEANPTETVLKAISEQQGKVKDAIIRLNISLSAELEAQLRDSDLRNALSEAYFFTIARDIKRETRLRLGNLAGEEITPLKALKAYIESKAPPYSPEQARTLLEYGERIIREHQVGQDTRT